MFSDHRSCNPSFCKHVEEQSDLEREPTSEEEAAYNGHSEENHKVTNDANQPEICQSMSLAQAL